MFSGKCSCDICFVFVFGVVLTVNPFVCVQLITFCISEWLAAFSFVTFFYFLVSFDEAVETVMQVWCNVQQPTSILVQKIMCTCNSGFLV